MRYLFRAVYVAALLGCLFVYACGSLMRTGEVGAGAATGAAVGGPIGAAVGGGAVYLVVTNSEQADTIAGLQTEIHDLRTAVLESAVTGKPVVFPVQPSTGWPWWKWAALGLGAWFAFKLAWPRYRQQILTMLGALFTLRLPTAAKSLAKAAGMVHTR